MGMNRRYFLEALAGMIATASFDREKFLWMPEEKKVFVPPMDVKWVSLNVKRTRRAGEWHDGLDPGDPMDHLTAFPVSRLPEDLRRAYVALKWKQRMLFGPNGNWPSPVYEAFDADGEWCGREQDYL